MLEKIEPERIGENAWDYKYTEIQTLPAKNIKTFMAVVQQNSTIELYPSLTDIE